MLNPRLSALVAMALLMCAAAAPVSAAKISPAHRRCLINLRNPGAHVKLYPFVHARIVGAPRCLLIGHGSHRTYVPAVTYDFTTVDPQLLSDLHLTSSTPTAVFFVVQKYPDPPQYQVLVGSNGVTIDQSNGDITVSAPSGATVQTRIGIIDRLGGPQSATFWWDSTKPQNSVGAALVDLSDPECRTADNCPGAQPPNWPNNFGPRSLIPASGYNFLAFGFPAPSSQTYVYVLRAFGAKGLVYTIDPKIKDQPTVAPK